MKLAASSQVKSNIFLFIYFFCHGHIHYVISNFCDPPPHTLIAACVQALWRPHVSQIGNSQPCGSSLSPGRELPTDKSPKASSFRKGSLYDQRYSFFLLLCHNYDKFLHLENPHFVGLVVVRLFVCFYKSFFPVASPTRLRIWWLLRINSLYSTKTFSLKIADLLAAVEGTSFPGGTHIWERAHWQRELWIWSLHHDDESLAPPIKITIGVPSSPWHYINENDCELICCW